LDFYFQVLLRWGFKRLADYLGGKDLPSWKSVHQKASKGYPIHTLCAATSQCSGGTILQSGKWSQCWVNKYLERDQQSVFAAKNASIER
jgi:hypothetical protein